MRVRAIEVIRSSIYTKHTFYLGKIPSLYKMSGNIPSNPAPDTNSDIMPRHSVGSITIEYVWILKVERKLVNKLNTVLFGKTQKY